ncbi:hypothetical protein DAPPUDRAFT_331896 [Daphnia pulex]|uniref:Uncharacterized protein n=1 Tax=Daphnia pulex TaxID=6669 RepID=E9HNS0_DAPPU|nr:hypothetical protein DAPPUDRAFT_331896 [Daphnia pulex]|eukprot:EFX66603.1 hypothetical protein DAPPUDRAFT_331896 [Daphnia pulex]
MTPGTKSGGGAEKDKHSSENDKNSAENDEIEVPKKSAETGGNQFRLSVGSFSISFLNISWVPRGYRLYPGIVARH